LSFSIFRTKVHNSVTTKLTATVYGVILSPSNGLSFAP
jgi:hypothetical protein